MFARAGQMDRLGSSVACAVAAAQALRAGGGTVHAGISAAAVCAALVMLGVSALPPASRCAPCRLGARAPAPSSGVLPGDRTGRVGLARAARGERGPAYSLGPADGGRACAWRALLGQGCPTAAGRHQDALAETWSPLCSHPSSQPWVEAARRVMGASAPPRPPPRRASAHSPTWRWRLEANRWAQ